MNQKDQPRYQYPQSLKSDFSDELINTYILRPTAGLLVRILYPTRITPNQVTIAAIVVGAFAAVLYAIGHSLSTILAGILVTLKDLLDSADGQLARAKNLYSRRGRFIDSIGDFVVNVLIFGAITLALCRAEFSLQTIFLGVAGLLGITLRVSYHVFYHVSYLHLENLYQMNRLLEDIREDDLKSDPVALRLQRIFLLIYAWQDRLMRRIDAWSKSPLEHLATAARQEGDRFWYSDRIGLRLSGFLGLGTELALLTVCSLLNNLEFYLWLNLSLMNLIWILTILYRKLILAPTLLKASTTE
ncbi:MAG: CDP-alcohol phosphatidyltransferase family protein [Bacteroidota bacterium]